jgi:hypothetical protein
VRRPRSVSDKHDHHRTSQRHGHNVTSCTFSTGRLGSAATDKSDNNRGPTSEDIFGERQKKKKKKKKKKKSLLFFSLTMRQSMLELRIPESRMTE